MYPAYHTVSDGPIFIYPSNFSIDAANPGLFGDVTTFYVKLALQGGCAGKYMPCVPGAAAVWQLAATCGVQSCYLVVEFTILSIDVDYLVDHVFIGSLEIS